MLMLNKYYNRREILEQFKWNILLESASHIDNFEIFVVRIWSLSNLINIFYEKYAKDEKRLIGFLSTINISSISYWFR